MVKILYTQTSSGKPVLWCKFQHYTTDWTFPVDHAKYIGNTVEVTGYVAGEGQNKTISFCSEDDTVKLHKDHIDKLVI